VTSGLYSDAEARSLPDAAFRASLGCGNPTALVDLHPGEVVLDLGSGGGIDVLLSARRVGPTGRAIGLDMTEGIDEIPLPADSVDVIISNCVINLAGDKRRVLAEAFRVLRPGGRLAVSDIVVRGDLPPELRRDVDALAGCVGGALAEQEFLDLLSEVGFTDPRLEFTRVYGAEDVEAMLAGTDLDARRISAEVGGRLGSAFVRGTKSRS
jgi:SAM-dependent methyltransferase